MMSGNITSSYGTTYGTYGDGSDTTANATSSLSGTGPTGPPPAPVNSMFGGLGQTQMSVKQTYYWIGNPRHDPPPPPAVNFTGSLSVTLSDIYEAGTASITVGSSSVNISSGTSDFDPTPTLTQDRDYKFKAYGVATLGSTAGSTGSVDGSHSAASITSGTWGDPV